MIQLPVDYLATFFLPYTHAPRFYRFPHTRRACGRKSATGSPEEARARLIASPRVIVIAVTCDVSRGSRYLLRPAGLISEMWMRLFWCGISSKFLEGVKIFFFSFLFDFFLI